MRVVYQDRTLLVVDKPAGLPTQAPAGGGDNVYDRLKEGHNGYVALHHRLDTGASGLVLFVLDQSANKAIAEAFRDHTIVRTYQAVAFGETASGPWDWPVQGKAAHSDVSLVGTARGLSAVVLSLKTGRKHQLRVHAAMAGTPLVGDRRYGGEAARRWPRLALHAARMRLSHPQSGETLVLSSPLPTDLADLWRTAGGTA